MHTQEWPMRLWITEDGDATLVRAELTTRDNTLTAEGRADRNPSDPSVPEIGDELAAGRALAELARQLMHAAASDVGGYSHPTPAVR